MKKWMALLAGLTFASISQGQGIIDKWDFNVANGGLSTSLSTSEIGGGGLAWPDRPAIITIDSQTMYFNKTASDGWFKGITPSAGWANVTGAGIIEFEVDYSDADWSGTAAGDFEAYADVGLRGPTGDIFSSIRYQGGLNTTNTTATGENVYADADHIALMFAQPDGPTIEIATFPGATNMPNLHVRVNCNLAAGTTDFYYTEEGGSEILAYSGTIPAGWILSEYRFSAQLKDGKEPTHWGLGDTLRLDNLTYTEISPPVPPPALALIDLWEFEGLANGAALSEAASTGYVGGVAFGDSALVSITNLVDNGALRITADPLDVEENIFLTATPSLYTGSSTGVYEVVMDVLSVDFTKTSVITSDGNFAFEVRNAASDAIGMQIEYDGSADHIEIGFEDATGEFVSKTIPGPVANNIQMRMLIDLDNAGTVGSAQFFYTVGGVEIGKYDGTVYPGFNFTQYRLRAAASVKGWQIGDASVIDNLRIEKVASLETPPVYVDIVDYQMNDSSGTLLNALSQTGTDTGHFDGTTPFIATDGIGSLEFNPVIASVTHKHILGTTFTKGINLLELALDDWNLDASTDDCGVSLALVDDTGTNSVKIGIDVNTNNATVRFRAVANNGGTFGQDTSYGSYVASTGVVIRLEVNLDTDTFSASWKYDTGGEFVEIVSGGNLGLLDNISEVRLDVTDMGWDATDYVNMDYLVLSSTSDEAPWSPTTRWNEWLGSYPGLGTSTNETDDFDLDGYNNVYEYGLGGDPTVPNSAHIPTFGDTAVDSGTNYILYVYAKLSDNTSANRGLSYSLNTTDNLVYVPWTNANYDVIGTSADLDGFKTVTNRVSTDTKDAQFIKLKIDLNL